MDRRKAIKLIMVSGAGSALGQNFQKKIKNKNQSKPNIIYFLADDLGYGELGCYGQEKIRTPNIDQLAAEGMRFTQHYSGSPVCAPSRCVLLTGKHTGHAYIRGNDEWEERGKVWDYVEMIHNPHLEGQRPLTAGTETIGKMLQRKGYKTACIGKWGLGAPGTEGAPNNQGFGFFYGYICQRMAHTYYPTHLWKNDKKEHLENKVVPFHTSLDEGTDPYDPSVYKNFTLTDYSPDMLQREALNFIEENRDNPFFLYYASPIPHLPLQAPQAYVERYRKIFRDEIPYTGNNYFPHPAPKSAYAAMITYLDDQVGQVVQKLKKLGLYENTLIIFSSDNGPTYTGGVDTAFFNSATPFQNGYGRTKGFTYEGGIRVPMIACWPDHIAPKTESDHISAFWDVLPTLAELTGGTVSDEIDGISFLPSLLGKDNQKQHAFLYWEFPAYQGQQTVRMGKWKGIRKDIFKGNMKIELYDLETDIREQHDLAPDHPEIVKKIEKIMVEQHIPAKLESFKMKQLGD